MKQVKQIVKYLRGKRTYIVGTLTIILGVLNGDSEMIMLGLGMMTLRAGMK